MLQKQNFFDQKKNQTLKNDANKINELFITIKRTCKDDKRQVYEGVSDSK